MNANRVNTVLVTNSSAANTGTSLATIAPGDVLVLNGKNTNLTGTPTVSSADGNSIIRIALGLPEGLPDSGNKLRLSSNIIGQKITSWTKQDFAAPVEKEVYIGYNGSGNALSLAAEKEYKLEVVLFDRHRMMPHRQSGRAYFYTTGTTVDNYSAASSLAGKINSDTRYMRNKLVATVIQNGGTITEFANDAILVKGSKLVTITAHGTSVGDLVIFRNVVYKVAAITNVNGIQLDRAYSGNSETIDVSATADLAGTLATVTGYGIKIQALPVVARKIDLYQQINFTAGLSPINGVPGDEEIITENAPNFGKGYYKQVQDMEFMEAGYRGITNRTQFPIDDYTPIANSSGTYRLYTIEHSETVNNNVQVIENPKTTIIAFDISGGTTKAAAFEAIMDSYIASVGLPAV